MSSSRIFVRNLPVNLTEQDFEKFFSAKHPTTDVKLIAQRRIGYVGYHSPEQAQDAVKYFNKSFIRMSKLHVEIAKPAGDRTVHPTRLQSNRNDDGPPPQQEDGAQRDSNPLKRKRRSPPPTPADPKLQEFLNVMQAPSKAKSWVHDSGVEAQTVAAAAVAEAPAEPGNQSDDEYQQITKKSKILLGKQERSDQQDASEKLLQFADQTSGQTLPSAAQDDSDWLKSRTGQSLEQDIEHEQDGTQKGQNSVETDGNEKVRASEEESTFPRDSAMEASDSDRNGLDENIQQIEKSKRLFLRNLPYTVTEEALMDDFSRFGRVEEVHVSMDNRTGTAKGLAYILYDKPEAAIEAFKSMDGSVFQGRLLHILPAAAKRETKLNDYEISKLPLKQQKQIKRKAEASNSSFNWNAMYMNPDAVLSSIASRLGVSKSTLLDPTSSNAAVKQTQAETHIIQETKKYFADNGVDLEAFRSKKRGDTAILVKNFPFGTTIDELRHLFEQYGRVVRLLMPPSGTIAIVEFAVAPEARAAFKSLAYRKIKDSILFLEPAPRDLFSETAKTASQVVATGDGAIAPKLSANDLLQADVQPDAIDTTTLHVRNLNFSTTTQKLTELFAPVQGFVSAVVRTRFDSKKNETLSWGYGFLEFRSKEEALAAMKAMNGYSLEGHKIEIKVSQKTLDAGEERRKSDKAKAQAARRTKLIIKNLAFEASKKDIRELVKQYGSIRSVRLPRKHDNSLRGFAFVEFSTPLEAQQALDALKHSHYHGRKLVIDFAEADAEDAEAELAQMAAKVNSQVNKLTAQKLMGGGRKKFNVSGEAQE